MKGTIQNNIFDVQVDLKKYTSVPNTSVDGNVFTNMAGITTCKDKIYLLKANANNKSSLSVTDNINKKPSKINIVLDAHCVGLSSNGESLVSIGIDKQKTWWIYVINTDTYEYTKYLFDKSNKRTYAGIAYVKGDIFCTCYSNDKNKTLIIREFNINASSLIHREYELKNMGYAEMIQDIYYDKEYGLFVTTNQKINGKYSSLKNIVLLYNIRNESFQPYKPIIKFRFNFNTKYFKQCNVESLCIINNRLTVCMNVVDKNGKSDDSISYANNATFENGTFISRWPIEYGREFAYRYIKDEEFVDIADKEVLAQTSVALRVHQSLSYAKGKVYGLMIATADSYEHRNYSGLYYMPDYMNRNINKNKGTKYITFNRYTKNLKENKIDMNNLYHCNSLNFDGEYFYVGCCERANHTKLDENGNPYYSIAKMDINGKILAKYKFEHRTNCIMPYKNNMYMVIAADKNFNINGEELKCIYVGSFVKDRFVSEDTYYIKNTMSDICNGMQDAYYNDNVGLFLAWYTSGMMYNTLLHYNLNKYTLHIDSNGKTYKILTPDYGFYFDVEKMGGDLLSVEYESPTVDEDNNCLLIGCNAKGKPDSKIKGSYDCILRLKDLTVKV